MGAAQRLRFIGSLAVIAVGIATALSFVVSGPRAYSLGWGSVVGGVIAGGAIVWLGVRLARDWNG
jgi:hypothetical protein